MGKEELLPPLRMDRPADPVLIDEGELESSVLLPLVTSAAVEVMGSILTTTAGEVVLSLRQRSAASASTPLSFSLETAPSNRPLAVAARDDDLTTTMLLVEELLTCWTEDDSVLTPPPPPRTGRRQTAAPAAGPADLVKMMRVRLGRRTGTRIGVVGVIYRCIHSRPRGQASSCSLS